MLFHCPCTSGLIPLNTCFTLCLKGENKSPYWTHCTFHPCLSSTRSKSKVFPAQKSSSLKPSTCVKRNRFLNKACDWRWERGTGLFFFFALYPNIDAASIFGSSEIHILFSVSHPPSPHLFSLFKLILYQPCDLPPLLFKAVWVGGWRIGGEGYFG